jgi:DnaJ-class molecular chaperone
VEITPELQQAYRKAAKLMYPDRATTDREHEGRTALMVEVNRACELDDN